MEESSTMNKTEASYSNGSNDSETQRPNTTHSHRPNKQNGSSSRFKGVIYQQNGHWGAQIYTNHHRIWLGTFKTETAAATAYDSAAIKLRQGNSGEAYRNFPWTPHTMYEPDFQAHYSVEQVLDMIKDGSYQAKFDEFISSIFQDKNTQTSNHNKNQEGYHCQELFRKELTPSDVGKLNRLVIPKRYALKCFPINNRVGKKVSLYKCDEGEENQGDMELSFYDTKRRSWKFRYCYWKSSQSFVLTRGWNKFVRVKKLEAKDIVTFYKCEMRENNVGDVKKFWMIDIVKSKASDDELEKGVAYGSEKIQEGKVLMVQGEATKIKKDVGFKLFGVQIDSTYKQELEN